MHALLYWFAAVAVLLSTVAKLQAAQEVWVSGLGCVFSSSEAARKKAALRTC